jgi:hypothetical protein
MEKEELLRLVEAALLAAEEWPENCNDPDKEGDAAATKAALLAALGLGYCALRGTGWVEPPTETNSLGNTAACSCCCY